MKLMRVGEPGRERPAMIDSDGIGRDLSGVVDDIAGSALSPSTLAELAALDAEQLPLIDPSQRVGPCVGSVSKFIGIGLNYADHAAESGLAIPTEPIVFNKATSCISGPNDNITLPHGAVKTDWEVELGIVIGSRAQSVSVQDARNYVAGFCLCNDVSERGFQGDRNGQWTKGKSSDTFGPIGPHLVTSDEIADPQNLRLELEVNGETMQQGNTSTMIFDCDTIVSYLSFFMTLEPGDVICTGTPPGVGQGMKPPRFLTPGDVVTLGGQGLGHQRQVVVASDRPTGTAAEAMAAAVEA